MAKYKNIQDVNGKPIDLVVYNLNGVQVVRKKSGFSTENFENNPNYSKVKENSSEFGHCSKAGKLIRQSLQPYIEDCGDKYMYQKFAKIMTQIKDLDTQNPKGKRRIEVGLATAEGQKLLSEFKFGHLENVTSKINKLESLFTKPFSLAGRTSAKMIQLITLKPDFDAQEIEISEQNYDITKNATYEFNYKFDDEDFILHFIVLRREDKVFNAGFIFF